MTSTEKRFARRLEALARLMAALQQATAAAIDLTAFLIAYGIFGRGPARFEYSLHDLSVQYHNALACLLICSEYACIDAANVGGNHHRFAIQLILFPVPGLDQTIAEVADAVAVTFA